MGAYERTKRSRERLLTKGCIVLFVFPAASLVAYLLFFIPAGVAVFMLAPPGSWIFPVVSVVGGIFAAAAGVGISFLAWPSGRKGRSRPAIAEPPPPDRECGSLRAPTRREVR